MSKMNPLRLVGSVLFCVVINLTATFARADEEPGVTIRETEEGLVQEFRENGFVYAIKVTPKKGPPYYLVRADGTQGDFIRTDQPKMLVPSWTLLSW